MPLVHLAQSPVTISRAQLSCGGCVSRPCILLLFVGVGAVESSPPTSWSGLTKLDLQLTYSDAVRLAHIKTVVSLDVPLDWLLRCTILSGPGAVGASASSRENAIR